MHYKALVAALLFSSAAPLPAARRLLVPTLCRKLFATRTVEDQRTREVPQSAPARFASPLLSASAKPVAAGSYWRPFDTLKQTIDANDLATLAYYLSSGWDPNACDRDGKTLLMHAAAAAKTEAIIVLLQCPAIKTDLRTAQGETAFTLAKNTAIKDLIATGPQVGTRRMPTARK